MARPKAKAKPVSKAKIIGVRASGSWADWLERAAQHDRLSVAAFLDRAAALYARQIGFTEAPPDRGGD